ncbi:MAG: GH116 family glycosyl-hydrolase [bacterium]
MPTKLRKEWPVLTHYDREHLTRIALPLGGIGTGTVSLGGRGDLRDWEIMNRPAKGYNGKSIFVLYAREAGKPPVLRALEGVLEPPYEGSHGCTQPYHGLPRFRECEFHTAYPFGQVCLSDPDVPLRARIEAFNPLIPADPDSSGIPIAILRFVLMNKTARGVKATLCGSLTNFIGYDGKFGKCAGNINAFREEGKLRGIFMTSKGVDSSAEQYGTIALTTTAPKVTYKRSWPEGRWGVPLLHFWDDLAEDGRLTDVECPPQDSPTGSLAVEITVPPRDEREALFLLTWHFPNRQTWTPSPGGDGQKDRVGNYYATRYEDAWDVARSVVPRLPELEAKTIDFVSTLLDSDLPNSVKEAALYNLSTLRTQTCFRTEDGLFFGWEGCHDDAGCCHGSCTHVWNYEQATAFLFGDLARKMREVEFLRATEENGRMSFRVNLPIERATEYGLAAADGQMGCIMKAYRDWQLSGDDEMLGKLWPNVKKALEFCWIEGGWDGDKDGVMEGCQHNTLDVEYYGPNPLMGAWYLGALRAAEEMARYLGEEDFASVCRNLFERGRNWVDENLFDGDYYEHKIVPPEEGGKIAEGLRSKMGSEDLREPDFQVGPGCLVDQLVGQFMAHVCGLGYLLDKEHVYKTLKSIMKYNFKTNLYGHFNNMRTFALNDEQALLMCTFPKGGRPKRPVPYFNEVMTGFEYSTAVHMLYEGQVASGLKAISAIRARYDGRRRNPFDEAECGHHYARAMASWAAVLALTGFRYSGVEKSMAFAPGDGTYFWSNGYAWGTCKQRSSENGVNVTLSVLHGSLTLKRFALTGCGQIEFEKSRTITAGETVRLRLKVH